MTKTDQQIIAEAVDLPPAGPGDEKPLEDESLYDQMQKYIASLPKKSKAPKK